MMNPHVGFIPSSANSPRLKPRQLSVLSDKSNDFNQQFEDFRNITTLFEPLVAQKSLHSLFSSSPSHSHSLPSSRHSPATTPREERRKGNEQKQNQNRTRLIDIYLELKDSYFDHHSLLLQKEALQCLIFVKKKKRKLRDMKEFPIDDLAEMLRNCHSNIAVWKGTQDKFHHALKQHRDLCGMEHIHQASHSLPLDEILQVLADDWHAVLITFSRILAKVTKRTGRSYPTDGGGFPRLFDVLEKYFALVNEVYAIFPRAYLRKTIKNHHSNPVVPSSLPPQSSSSPSSTQPQQQQGSRTPHTPRTHETHASHAHTHAFTHAITQRQTSVGSTFSFLATPSLPKSSPVPKLALGSVYLSSSFSLGTFIFDVERNTISPNPTIKPLASIAQAIDDAKNSARGTKETRVLNKTGFCKILATARAHFVFNNYPHTPTPPSISNLEDIFFQETRFISSSPLHTPHPFSVSSNSKKIENLEMDFDFGARNSTDGIPTLSNENGNLGPRSGNTISNSGTIVDNAWYLEVFSQELCRLFRVYSTHCADLQTTENLEALIQPPKAAPFVISHQIALECHRAIVAIWQFGTHQGNYYKLLLKEKFRLPPPNSSPLGTMYITEPFKALIQALDHTSKLSHRLHDLPSLSHFLSQHFSLFVSVVHWANTPKTLSLPLPSLCIFLSNIRIIAQKLKSFCDSLNRDESAQSKLQRSRQRYRPTIQIASSSPSSSSSSSSSSPSSSLSAYPSQFRHHQHLLQQLHSLHFYLLLVSGHISEKIDFEGRALVSKFAAAATNDNFTPRKSAAGSNSNPSSNSEKSGGAIFVASSRSKSNLATSLTSLSFPSVPSPNETILPTPVIQKMVDKILDPALATLLQCEEGTRYGVVTMFLRSVLVGLEHLILKKIAPRSLSFNNIVQIASDVEFIRVWAVHAEEAFHSLNDVRKREEEEDGKEGLEEMQEMEDEEEEEEEEGEKRDDSFSSRKSGSFSGYRISNMQSIHESFKNKNNNNNNNNNKNNKKKNKNTLPPVEEIQTPFSKSKDFERWERIIEILTSCTTSERVMTREDLENSPIPDANNWINLCKKRDKN